MDRRIFVQSIGFGGAGLLLLPQMITSCSDGQSAKAAHRAGGGGLLPLAFIGACAEQNLSHPELSEQSRTMLHADINLDLPGNLSRLGVSMPFNLDDVLTSIQKQRDMLGVDGESTLKKCALLTGWMIAQPLQNRMGKVIRKLLDKGNSQAEIQAHLDVQTLLHFSGDPNLTSLSNEDLKEYFHTFLARMTTRLHTLKPDYADGPGWVVRMGDWRMGNSKRIETYTAQMMQQESSPMDRHLSRTDLFDAEKGIFYAALEEGISVAKEALAFFDGEENIDKLRLLLT